MDIKYLDVIPSTSNLAGAEIALKLMDKIEKLEDSMSQMRYQLNMLESRSNPREIGDGTNSTQ